jgi:hypothetical protein
VPVYVRTGGTAVSNFITMSIQSGGGLCATDIFPEISGTLVSGGKAAVAGVIRASTRHDVGLTAPVDVTADHYAYFAAAAAATAFPYHPYLSFMPTGTCMVYSGQGDFLGGDTLPGTFPSVTALNLGSSLALTGPSGSSVLSPQAAGSIGSGYLGGVFANNPSTLVLNPGSYTLSGSGGTMSVHFRTRSLFPNPWSGPDAINSPWSTVNSRSPFPGPAVTADKWLP